MIKGRYVKTHRTRDINRSVLAVSAQIVDYLSRKNKNSKFNDLLSYLKSAPSLTEKDIMYSINFLYILGKIRYEMANDIMVLTP